MSAEQLQFRYRTFWRRNPIKELDDFVRLRWHSLPLAEIAPPAHRRLMSLLLIVMNQINRRLEDRVMLRKESPPVKDIPSRKLPFEAGCGVMMLREMSE